MKLRMTLAAIAALAAGTVAASALGALYGYAIMPRLDGFGQLALPLSSDFPTH